MSFSNSQLIIFTELKDRIDQKKPLVEKIRDAFKLVKSDENWLVTDDNEALQIGLALALQESAPEEKELIRRELRALSQISIGMIPDDIPENPIGLLAIWREIEG